MRRSIIFVVIAAAIFSLAALPRPTRARPQKKEYLSDEEADKIRDAQTPNLRVKLYLGFAADRLKKFQYELDRTLPQSRRGETLNGLLNAYAGCIDDAADVISLAVEKQQEIRAGIKEMQSKAKEYLATLEKIQEKGTDVESYKDTLEDAIEGTKDAINDAQQAEKEMAPPPVRRPQS
jgi:peptidoglycan hydrolase CwlO-like protein